MSGRIANAIVAGRRKGIIMKKSTLKLVVALSLNFLIGACSAGGSPGSEEATGKGAIRALHAIPDLGPVTFLIEETALAEVDFKQVSGTESFDNITFVFNFDILLPNDSDVTRLASREVTVVEDIEFTFILSGSLEAPEIILWEQFRRDWIAALADADTNDTTITILDLSFGHLARDLGALDFYIAEPGTLPVPGNQIASLAFGDLQESIELEAGTYQLVVTDSGMPSDFLFASEAFSLTSARSVAVVVMDGDDSSTGSFSVRLLGEGTGTELIDINAVSTMRVVHAALNTDELDLVVGDQFASPLFSGLTFGERSVPAIIISGEQNLNITPAGNPGSFLAEETINITKGNGHTFYLTGLPGQLDGILLRDGTRRLSTHAFLRSYQGAIRQGSIDLYLVAEGSDISLLSPNLASLPYTGATGYQPVVPGTYELVLTLPGTKTIIAEALSVDLKSFGIYDVVVADTVQTDRAQILFYADE